MRAAFSALELILSVMLLGIVVSFALPKHTSLHKAAQLTLAYIRYTQHLALNDSLNFATLRQTRTLTKSHPSIDPNKLLDSSRNLWQIQFHQSGIYTLNSFSVFFDTPRFSPTTDRDNQPQPGDIIARNGANMRCLTGYSNVNAPIECRNNGEILVRLHERFAIDGIELMSENACQEMGTFRIGFNHLGKPFCQKIPRALQGIMQILLRKDKKHKSICILPHSGYAFIASQC